MLGQGPSGIVGHDLLPTAPMFRYYLLSPGHAERLSRSPRLKSAWPRFIWVIDACHSRAAVAQRKIDHRSQHHCRGEGILTAQRISGQC